MSLPIKVVGLDLSLTSTGVAFIAGGGPAQPVAATDRIRHPKLTGHPRIVAILAELDLWTHGATLAVVEGLAYDAHDTDRQNAGLNWIVRHRLHTRRIPYALVPPATLKQYATGSGSADKTAMAAAAAHHLPGIDCDDDNAVDALWLAHTGADHLGIPIAALPDEQRAAVLEQRTVRRRGKDVTVGVRWPDWVRAA